MTSRVLVEADGGSRGNPGPAGAGAVVKDAAGTVLAERAVVLGETTNNVAEYRGLIAGLRAAHELGADEVDVRMDSKLVVEQMAGRWKVKHANLQPLAAEARELIAQFGRVGFEWIPRAQNAHADRLANEAMDGTATDGSAAPADSGEIGREQAAAARSRPSGWQDLGGEPTRVLLLRHGQTRMSVDRRYSGRVDVELTELGARQADAAAKRLAGMDGVAGAPIITSPLTRARQTAGAVAEATGGELELHDGLLETDFGDWDGLTFPEAAERYPELHRAWIGDPTVVPPNGESLETVHERVLGARDDLLQRYPGRTIVVVSHVTPIKSFLRMGLGSGPELFYRLHLDLASLSIVEFYPDRNTSVRLVNDISHWA
ncbi:bifunctional RNase H/acid phosphatase [Saccharopolyspora griseoalba]|uniref:Bifunctional RNase H/acid phosphatase n=1 Tax=Saccharopolyspora griseoalba TaxID=1431848 RepID=A0ABW2LK35_9PSEU